MPITASKYINNSDLKTSYIGLYNYKRPSRGKNDFPVDMYGLLFVSSEVEIPGDKLLKFAWDGIVDGFEYSKIDSTNESLKLALSESTRRVKQLITNDPEIGNHGVDINFTIFVSNNGGIYIGLLGESDIFVYKKGRLVDIFEMLSSKKAKTAAVAIEGGDLIFSSTKGVLKENMQRLISAKDREELIFTLEELGKEIGDDMGLVVLTKEIEEKKVGVIGSITSVKKNVEEKEPSAKEPSNSDYIPESKVSKKIFRTPEEEKDLRDIFHKIFKKFSFIKTGINKVLPALSSVLKKMGNGISVFFKKGILNVKEKISQKLGKKRWFKRVSATVSQGTLGKKKATEFKEFRIDGYKQRGTRLHRIKIVAFIFLGLALLVAGIKFTIDQKEAREISKVANSVFIQVEDFLSDAQSKMGTDRAGAQILVFRASDELSKLPKELSTKDKERYEELKGQVLGIEDSLYKKIRLSISNGSIEKYYDTFNSNQDSKPEDIGIYRDGNGNEYLVITDIGSKSVYTISLYDKKVANIKDDNKVLNRPFKVYARSQGIFVLDLENGVLKAEATSSGFNSFVKLSGLSIQSMGIKDAVEFAVLTDNQNAYVLDRERESLLKSVNYDGGYSLASSYLSKEEYRVANDVFSDLSVYILAEGENGVYRYISTGSGMVESPIALTGLDTPLKNPKSGFTVDSLNNGLFIFDSEDRRVLKFEKPIEAGEKRHPNELLLLNQYIFEDSNAWKNVKDIVVDYKEKNLYVLDGTTIWKVRL